MCSVEYCAEETSLPDKVYYAANVNIAEGAASAPGNLRDRVLLFIEFSLR